jgi:hypothetical protein
MSEQKFIIKKQGNYFVAFDTIDTKRSYGKINIKTCKFIGDTRCLVELSKHWDKEVNDKEEAFYDEVLFQIKTDIAEGDFTALDELLRSVPRKNLEAYLPEKPKQ